MLDESADGVAGDLPPAAFRNQKGIGKEDACLPDKDLGLTPFRAVLPLEGTDRREILIKVSPDRRFHAGIYVTM